MFKQKSHENCMTYDALLKHTERQMFSLPHTDNLMLHITSSCYVAHSSYGMCIQHLYVVALVLDLLEPQLWFALLPSHTCSNVGFPRFASPCIPHKNELDSILELNAFQAAGEWWRQVINLTNVVQNVKNCGISWPLFGITMRDALNRVQTCLVLVH